MSSNEILMQAILNRLRARIGKKAVESLTDLINKAEEAPQIIQDKWKDFKEEVILEVDRIEKDQVKSNVSSKTSMNEHQLIISNIRKKISNLNSKIEVIK